MPTDDVWGLVQNEEAGKAPAAFHVIKDGKTINTVRLEPDVTYIGRMPENHIVLDDAEVSRSHARVIVKGKQFVLEDQESENGIFVKDKKVQSHTLVLGDTIRIGQHILQFTQASSKDRTAIREAQLDSAEEEEWRQDQTVSLSSDELQKEYAKRLKKVTQSHNKPPAPTVELTLVVGKKTFKKNIQLDSIEKHPSGQKQPTELDITLTAADWVFKKKTSL